MRPFLATLVALALVANAVPAASGAWSAWGATEPDNALDDDTLLWPDAPGDETDRVYFNGWAAVAAGLVGFGVNPNVALLETRMEPAGAETYLAILGVWTDCNGDGYVGLLESAAPEYEDALLLNKTLCPPMFGPVDAWHGEHNYNGWVSEYIPIGTNGGQVSGGLGNIDDLDGDGIDNDNGLDLRIYRDLQARVWLDFSLPDAIPTGGGGAGCPILPAPRGTFSDTGGMLDHADCSTGLLEAWNTLVDAAGAPGLRFADPDDGRSGELGRVETFGSDDSRHAAVTVTDCAVLFDSSPVLHDALDGIVGEDTVDTLDPGLVLREPSPRLTDASDPTIAAQVNQTNEELLDDCDTTNDGGQDLYSPLLERGAVAPPTPTKTTADLNLEFDDVPPFGGAGVGGRGSPPFDLLHAGPSGAGPTSLSVKFHEWRARAASVGALPRTVRADLAEPAEQPRYVTFYGYVGTTTSDLGFRTPGGLERYGATQCPLGVNEGAPNGWECDPTRWYAHRPAETEGGLARVGALYNLRDIDCYDGGNNAGVPLGGPALAGNGCGTFAG